MLYFLKTQPNELWGPKTKATLSALILRVSEQTDVPIDTLKGPRREKHIARARQLFMYRAHKRGFSTPQVGRFLGDRDHTTVLCGIRRIEAVKRGEVQPVYEAELY